MRLSPGDEALPTSLSKDPNKKTDMARPPRPLWDTVVSVVASQQPLFQLCRKVKKPHYNMQEQSPGVISV
jgi:hypothetical protein